MFPFFVALIFLILLELRLLWYDESMWPLVAHAAYAALSSWYISRRISIAVLALFLATLAIAFLLFFSPEFLMAQATALVFSLLFFLFVLFVRWKKPYEIVVISFLQLLAFLFLVFSYHLSYHVPFSVAGVLVFAVSSALFFISVTLAVELGLWLRLRLLCISLVAGLLISEFYFVLSKLSFHIVSIDFMLFLIYYVLWDTTFRYFSLQFTKRSLALNVGILIIGLGATLASAKWFP